METFEVCVPVPDAPLVIVVSVIPAEDAGWLEAMILGAIWEGRPPYRLLKWMPDILEDYADEVEFWPDTSKWRRREKGRLATRNVYRAIVRPGR